MQQALIAALFIAVLGITGMGQDERKKTGAEAIRRVSTGLRAVAHEGCVVRGALWSGKMTPGKRVLVPVFLFKNNDYFIVVAPDRGRPDPGLKCEMRDVAGVAQPTTEVRGKNRLVLSFRPKVSGRFYVSLLLPEGAEPAEVSMGYAYE